MMQVMSDIPVNIGRRLFSKAWEMFLQKNKELFNWLVSDLICEKTHAPYMENVEHHGNHPPQQQLTGCDFFSEA